MLIVQKFGGTSVGSIERMKQVAERVIKTKRAGHDVVVVVSAMSGETDRLVGLARQIDEKPEGREYDVLLSTGEQASVALVSMWLEKLGQPAQSMLGHQMRILTDSAFSKARIQSVGGDIIRHALDQGKVVVAAGFQGVDAEGNITTLGRGGSDTTAVALAAALGAGRGDVACEIYTDVDGVFTADPNVVPTARKVDRIAYEEMLELASLGAKVLQIRSVELGMNHNVPIWVKNTFSSDPGTVVCHEDEDMERVVVRGVSCSRDDVRILVRQCKNNIGTAAKLFGALAEANIVVDVIVQNIADGGHVDVSFTVPRADLPRARDVTKSLLEAIGAAGMDIDNDMAKVSIVGVGMRSHAGVAARMFSVLAKSGIDIHLISTSEIKVSCVIDRKYAELAVRVLHDEFELAKKPAAKKELRTKKAAAM
jgi:aspartate kinase